MAEVATALERAIRRVGATPRVVRGSDGGDGLLDALAGRVRRYVLISSCDVYRDYGLLTQTEAGEPNAGPITEAAPLRTSRYPYRGPEPRPDPRPISVDPYTSKSSTPKRSRQPSISSWGAEAPNARVRR